MLTNVGEKCGCELGFYIDPGVLVRHFIVAQLLKANFCPNDPQEFREVIFRDKKGEFNLAADHPASLSKFVHTLL